MNVVDCLHPELKEALLGPITEIKINRHDIEQAMSWYHELDAYKITENDRESFRNLLAIAHKMRRMENI